MWHLSSNVALSIQNRSFLFSFGNSCLALSLLIQLVPSVLVRHLLFLFGIFILVCCRVSLFGSFYSISARCMLIWYLVFFFGHFRSNLAHCNAKMCHFVYWISTVCSLFGTSILIWRIVAQFCIFSCNIAKEVTSETAVYVLELNGNPDSLGDIGFT